MTTHRRFNRGRSRALLLGAAALFMTADAVSEAAAQAMLDEIKVTARKREESLQDVPISVAVATGEQMERMSITRLEDLSLYLPSIQIAENAAQQSVFIRGIGSGANQGFEQSVGTYIDGVYYGRSRSSRNLFLDLARVEVLKGPQGTLFGKNTIAGAINITTNGPTEEFEASIEGEYFTDIDKWGVTGVLSGPLSDTVRARVVGRFADQGGYVTNTFTGNKEPEREEYAVRATVDFDISEKLQLTLKAEMSEYNDKGRATQLVAVSPVVEAAYLALDPAFETNMDYTKSNADVEFDDTDTFNALAKLVYSADTYTLTALTGYVSYDFVNDIRAEYTPASYMSQSNDQDYEQFSQELRFESDFGGPFEMIAGLFYQKEDLNIIQSFNLNLSAGVAQGMPLPPFDFSRVADYAQDTESYAAFAQATYNVTDAFRVNLGLRYTNDQKDLFKTMIIADLNTRTPNPALEPVAGNLGWLPHVHDLSRSDKDLAPQVTLQYDVNDDIMAYATYSEGMKSGGFDVENATGNVATADFDAETAKNYEAGLKTVLMDGAMNVNFSAFRTEFSDLQVSATNGIIFAVTNAAEAVTQGVEMDGRWRINEELSFNWAATWLDAKFNDFPDAVCTAAQQTASGLGGACSQDLSDKVLQFSPDISGYASLQYETELGGDYLLNMQGDVSFTSSYYTALDLDPASKQSGFGKINLRAELSGVSQNWSVAVLVKNLTDKKTTTWVNDAPLVRGNLFSFIDPPRTFGLQVKLAM